MTSKDVPIPAEVQSAYFEYQKMEAMMSIDVGICLPGFRFAKNNIVREFVNAHLLIDLFSVFDKAVDAVFAKQKLKSVKKKSKLTVLQEAGYVEKHDYITWYKEWRNGAAHDFGRLQEHLLNQASSDIKRQLVLWELVEDLVVQSFSEEISDDEFHYGAKVDQVPVLVHWIKFQEPSGFIAQRCTYKEDINLTYHDYLKKLVSLTL